MYTRAHLGYSWGTDAPRLRLEQADEWTAVVFGFTAPGERATYRQVTKRHGWRRMPRARTLGRRRYLADVALELAEALGWQLTTEERRVVARFRSDATHAEDRVS